MNAGRSEGPEDAAASDALLELHPFEQSHADAVRVAAAARRDGTWLRFAWTVHAPRDVVRTPSLAAAPARTERLWEHTCLEAFFAPAGSATYWELNVAPSGDWDLYRFDGHRQGMMREARVAAPGAFSRSDAAGLVRVDVGIDLAPLGAPAAGALDVALTAVVEDAAGATSYWALAHPAARPDFHRRDGFVLRLPPATVPG